MTDVNDRAEQLGTAGVSSGSPREYSARFSRAGDEPGIHAVLAATFPRWPKAEIAVDPVEHLRWKLSNHLDLPHHHVVAELDGRIVGTQGIIIQRIKIDGRVFLSSQGFDVAVHPQYQNTGVRSRMNVFSLPDWNESWDLHYTLQSGHPAEHRVGLKNAVDARDPRESAEAAQRRVLQMVEDQPLSFANRIEALVHPLRPLFSESGRAFRRSDSAMSLARGIALSGVALAGRLRTAIERPRPSGWTVRRVDSFDERFERFWDEASAPFVFIVERTPAYLNWRYADPRAGSFTILVAEDDNRVLGYLVLQRSYGKGYIADLLALPGRLDVAASLAQSALVRFRDAGVSTVECWSPRHHPYRPVLRRAGFLCKHRNVSLHPLPGRGLPERLALVDDPRAAIHVAIGDTDLV